jgi:hypothetical protein
MDISGLRRLWLVLVAHIELNILLSVEYVRINCQRTYAVNPFLTQLIASGYFNDYRHNQSCDYYSIWNSPPLSPSIMASLVLLECGKLKNFATKAFGGLSSPTPTQGSKDVAADLTFYLTSACMGAPCRVFLQ